MQVFNENEILFCSKTNPCGSFPEFRTVRGGLRKGKAVFRHFVMKLSEPKVLQVNLNVRGRDNQSRNLSCSQISLSYGPSKILQPLSGGCGTRPSIRSWDEGLVYMNPILGKSISRKVRSQFIIQH